MLMRENNNISELSSSRLKTDTQVSLQFFLLCKCSQGLQIRRRHVFFRFNLYRGVITDDKIYLKP